MTLAVTIVMLGTGAAIDLMTRRIPNAVTVATAAIGIGLAATGVSHVTVVQSLLGLGLGMLLMLPGYQLGATGAGDVKLLGAAGAVLGIAQVPFAFLYTAVAGGVFAVVVACARGRLAETLRRVPRAGSPAEPSRRDRFFAYGPAIAVGCVLAALRV